MRKAVLCVILGLAFAGWAFALPSGPGGTIYFTSYDRTAGVMRYYYLNVDSTWTAQNSVTYYATITNDAAAEGGLNNTSGLQGGETRTPAVRTYVVPNATSGLQDMGGSYHNGVLFQAVYHNTTAYGTRGAGTIRGADYLGVQPDGSVVLYNDGIDGDTTSGRIPQTNTREVTGIIGSSVTPGGETWGILQEGGCNYNTWVGTFTANGMVTLSATATTPNLYSTWGGSIYQCRMASCAANHTVNGVAVKGAIVEYNYQLNIDNYGGWVAAYKDAVGSGYTVVGMQAQHIAANNPGVGFSTFTWNHWAVADTTGDGVPDVYYKSTDLGHATDKNNDGDWVDAGECWDSNVPSDYGEIRLVQAAAPDASFPGGHWVVMEFRPSAYGQWNYLKVHGLNAAGDWDGTTKAIMYDFDDATLALPASGTAVAFASQIYACDFNFAPLNAIPAAGKTPVGTVVQLK